MKRLIFATCLLAALAFPLRAFSQVPHTADSRKADLHLSSSLVVGTTTLRAGDYLFQCRHIDGKDFLVVTSAENGKEVARVPCRAEALDSKASTTEFRSTKSADGTNTLTAVRIKGESIAHRIAD